MKTNSCLLSRLGKYPSGLHIVIICAIMIKASSKFLLKKARIKKNLLLLEQQQEIYYLKLTIKPSLTPLPTVLQPLLAGQMEKRFPTRLQWTIGEKQGKYLAENFYPTVQDFPPEFMEFSIGRKNLVSEKAALHLTKTPRDRIDTKTSIFECVCTQDSFCHILGLASSLRMKWFRRCIFRIPRRTATAFSASLSRSNSLLL